MAQESSLGVESGVALSLPYRPLGAAWRRRKVGLRPQGWEEVLSQALPLRLPSWVTCGEACAGRVQVSAHLTCPLSVPLVFLERPA